MSSQAVAVIGGGWSGLTAAVVLADAGRSVTVYEAAKTLGGRARRVDKDGWSLDNGQHILLGAYRESLAMIRRVGGDALLQRGLVRLPLRLASPQQELLRTTGAPAPLHLLFGLLRTRALSADAKWKLIRKFLRLTLSRYRIQPDRTAAAWLADQDAAAIRIVWDPLCVAALNTPLAEASAQMFANVLQGAFAGKRSDADFLLPSQDLSALFPDAAAAYLIQRGSQVLSGHTAVALKPAADHGWTITTQHGTVTHREVVLATGPQHLARLVGGLSPAQSLVDCVERFAYQPIATYYFQLANPLQLPGPIIQLDGTPGQWLFDRGALGGRQGLYAVVISAEGPYSDLTREELAAALRAQLGTALNRPIAPGWEQVITEKRATYSCIPGLQRPRPGRISTNLPGLYLAGDYTDPLYPATLEAAVRSGTAAARALLAD